MGKAFHLQCRDHVTLSLWERIWKVKRHGKRMRGLRRSWVGQCVLVMEGILLSNPHTAEVKGMQSGYIPLSLGRNHSMLSWMALLPP